MNEYRQLRHELTQLQAQFEAKAFPLVPLYHDLIWSPDLKGWTETEFVALRKATEPSPFAMEKWELWSGKIACSRYSGNGSLPATRLADFRHLAARAYRILCALADIGKERDAVPDDFRLRIDCISEAYPDQPGAAVHFGWLELVSEAALYCPTARLQADNGLWLPGDEKASMKATHIDQPSHISLHLDVFEASAEFIRYCLEPHVVVALGNGLLPIYLPVLQEVPIWSSFDGELWFRGKIVKKFSKPAPHQRRLLDAFEASGWKASIPNPFIEPNIPQYLTEELLCRTAQDLSRSFEANCHIRFGSPHGGTRATWHTN